jgi:DNA-binding transcriptional MerR regulator
VNAGGLLKMSQLAERSGVSVATIKHYLREGLLGGPDQVVKTSRNMAYYPPDFVDRIRLIKRLQEERFMPLRVIREVLTDADRPRIPREEVLARFDLPPNVLDRLGEIGVLTPTSAGHDPDDLEIIEAIVRFRSGGYDEALGFTVYETLRYREALAPLVREEVRILLERLAGETPGRAAEIIRSGRSPLRELIGAMHSKMLLQELERQLEDDHPPPG